MATRGREYFRSGLPLPKPMLSYFPASPPWLSMTHGSDLFPPSDLVNRELQDPEHGRRSLMEAEVLALMLHSCGHSASDTSDTVSPPVKWDSLSTFLLVLLHLIPSVRHSWHAINVLAIVP